MIDTDLDPIEADLKQLLPASLQAEPRQSPKREHLPPQFPRTVNRHKPESTECACGCQPQRIGEDVSEKLDFTPEVFLLNVGRVLQEQKKQAQKNHPKGGFYVLSHSQGEISNRADS